MSGTDSIDLLKKVREHRSQGWQKEGPVISADVFRSCGGLLPSDHTLVQQMVKYD